MYDTDGPAFKAAMVSDAGTFQTTDRKDAIIRVLSAGGDAAGNVPGVREWRQSVYDKLPDHYPGKKKGGADQH